MPDIRTTGYKNVGKKDFHCTTMLLSVPLYLGSDHEGIRQGYLSPCMVVKLRISEHKVQWQLYTQSSNYHYSIME